MAASTITVNMFGSRLMESGVSLAFWTLASMTVAMRQDAAASDEARASVRPHAPGFFPGGNRGALDSRPAVQQQHLRVLG
jgi:hypothetical protein